jgi:hypothetical protein
MKVEIYLQLDDNSNVLRLPIVEVLDEDDIYAIAKNAWTDEQINNGLVCYDNLTSNVLCIPVDMDI